MNKLNRSSAYVAPPPNRAHLAPLKNNSIQITTLINQKGMGDKTDSKRLKNTQY